MRSWVSSFPYWGWAILFVAALKLHVPCGSSVHVGQCNCLRPLKFSCHARLMLMGHRAYNTCRLPRKSSGPHAANGTFLNRLLQVALWSQRRPKMASGLSKRRSATKNM